MEMENDTNINRSDENDLEAALTKKLLSGRPK